jgi:hypothetical protein
VEAELQLIMCAFKDALFPKRKTPNSTSNKLVNIRPPEVIHFRWQVKLKRIVYE